MKSEVTVMTRTVIYVTKREGRRQNMVFQKEPKGSGRILVASLDGRRRLLRFPLIVGWEESILWDARMETEAMIIALESFPYALVVEVINQSILVLYHACRGIDESDLID
jgi:hypothetical protein